jgi:SAM-dependent methyltransferase
MAKGKQAGFRGRFGALPLLSSRATIRIGAGLAAVVMLGLIALGGRCASPTMVSCSIDTLFSGGPKLDVPYKGTRPAVIARMLEMGEVGPGDHVIDLGTGDGRILIAAARERGASGLGIDLDAVLIGKAQANARNAGVADRVRFETGDLFKAELAAADVVMMYLLPEVNWRLCPRLLAQLKTGTRIVSHAFDMGDWRPDETRRAGGATVHLWRVPEPGARSGLCTAAQASAKGGSG